MPQKSAKATNRVGSFLYWKAGGSQSCGPFLALQGTEWKVAGQSNLELKALWGQCRWDSHSARQLSVGRGQGQRERPSFTFSAHAPTPWGSDGLWLGGGTVDGGELSENGAVLGGEMRLEWKINEVVLSGNEMVLGGKVRLHY